MDIQLKEESLPEPQQQDANKPTIQQQILHTFELYKDYTPPDWSSQPKINYYLEVLKDGVIIQEIQLVNKEFFLIGKYKDLCDIVLEHDSVSRKHAILQHKNNGTLFLYDLGSTHGTRINKRLIKSKQFFRVNPGDFIKFGESTRNYIVRCPKLEEDQEEKIVEKNSLEASTDQQIIDIMLKKTQEPDPNKQYTQKELKQLYLKIKAQLRKEKYEMSKGTFKGKTGNQSQNVDGISWGMVDDDEIYEMAQEDEDNQLINIDFHALRLLPNLTDKQMQKIDQVEAKRQKMENLENEIENLNEMELRTHGLEEGKKKRKEMVENKLNECALDYEMADDNLKLIIFGETAVKKKISKIQDEDTYGDDEFFDRTKVHKQVRKTDDEIINHILLQQRKEIAPLANTDLDLSSVENFGSLQKKLEFFIEERNKLNLAFLEIQESQNIEDKKEMEGDDDELGTFLKENEQKLIGEKKKQHLERLKYLQNQIEKTKALLQIIKPEITIKEPIVQPPTKLTDQQLSKVPKAPEPKPNIQQSNISKTLESLKQKSKAYHSSTAIQDPNIDDLTQYIPALKRLEEQERCTEMVHKDRMLLNDRQKKETEIEEEKDKIYTVKKRPKERNLTEVEAGESAAIKWFPPNNQKGDGKTQLNDKLGY